MAIPMLWGVWRCPSFGVACRVVWVLIRGSGSLHSWLQRMSDPPVIAPLGITEEGQLLNINADTVAGDIAKALSARHFLLLTDVPGVQDKDGDVLPSLTAAKARQLIRNGTISGGMIPKVTACLDALEGVLSAHIVDGREPHAVLRQLLTDDQVGTQFHAQARSS